MQHGETFGRPDGRQGKEGRETWEMARATVDKQFRWEILKTALSLGMNGTGVVLWETNHLYSPDTYSIVLFWEFRSQKTFGNVKGIRFSVNVEGKRSVEFSKEDSWQVEENLREAIALAEPVSYSIENLHRKAERIYRISASSKPSH